jgi:hypothetical protein
LQCLTLLSVKKILQRLISTTKTWGQVNLGEIQGFVYEDLNRNSILDLSFLQGSSPDVVFSIDLSGSVGSSEVDWRTTEPEQLVQSDLER